MNTQENPLEEHTDKSSDTSFLLIIAVIACIFILIFSIGYYFIKREKSQPPETITYKGFTFVNAYGLWNTEWQSGNNIYNLHFHYNPLQTENISVDIRNPLSASFNGTEYYITFDPLGNNSDYVKIAILELELSLVKTFGTKPIAACTENTTEACHSRPIITCKDQDKAVVYFINKEPAQVIIDDNCLTIQGKDLELVRATDKVLYTFYGFFK